ncbi:MAG: formate dehydrogenase subunit delta [Rudaea sp.]
MNVEHLASMVNDIANFFHAESDREVAIDGIGGHLKRYWEPRMRKQIIAYAQSHDSSELSDLARAGVTRLAELDAAKS